MIIVGAGMAGLIASAMIRDPKVILFEHQKGLPNNHSALLRFKSSVVGDAVGIPFRKVRVLKASEPFRNPVADAMAYSFKVSGSHSLRSSISASGEVEERYIAPPDFISRLGEINTHSVFYDRSLDYAVSIRAKNQVIISTVPMPSLMTALGWKTSLAFKSVVGFTITADLPKDLFDVCATVYIPNPRIKPYRASITDSKLIVEYVGEPSDDEARNDNFTYALSALGIGEWLWDKIVESAVVSTSKYAKILPIDENERKKFIIWASSEHSIYSLGRYATWRPTLLLDDLVNDVRVIERLISQPGEAYAHKLKG
jgi:hypothetical protein